jgi:hypothetical protein
VAKSREAMTLIWQIIATPNANPTQPVFFYTKIKVFQGNKIIHESIAHQKSLDAAFSVFCATNIGKDVFETGKGYEVKLFYFLPKLEGISEENQPSMKATFLQLIGIRTRE